RGSRKDLRDAIRAARTAFPSWAARTAMNRGQILYRAAEMLDGRRAQFVEVLGGGRTATREVESAVDALIWYAGWTDKLAQVAGNTNPVDRKSTRLNSSHQISSYADFCLKKKI